MNDSEYTRITIEPDKMGGVPCIRRLRIPVRAVARMVDDGMSTDEILALYPDLEAEDIPQAVAFARERMPEDTDDDD